MKRIFGLAMILLAGTANATTYVYQNDVSSDGTHITVSFDTDVTSGFISTTDLTAFSAETILYVGTTALLRSDYGLGGVASFLGSISGSTASFGVAAYGTTTVLSGPGAGFIGNRAQITTSGSAGAVPEVATWAMMLAGFGVIGCAARRRGRTGVKFA